MRNLDSLRGDLLTMTRRHGVPGSETCFESPLAIMAPLALGGTHPDGFGEEKDRAVA
jgi:hypothetical protein